MTDPTPEARFEIPHEVIRWDDFVVSCVAECPWHDGLCFGSADGRVRFTEQDPRAIVAEDYRVVESGEAINGIAFSGDLMAVSTRQEVAFVNDPEWGSGSVGHAVFEGGAHGVTALPGGGFAAPLGPDGLLLTSNPRGDDQPYRTIQPDSDEAFNFLKLAGLPPVGGATVLAGAARRSGLFGLLYDSEGAGGGSFRFSEAPGFDVVDVCSLATPAHPLAVAALGRDGSVEMVRDILRDSETLRLRLRGLSGRGYAVHRAGGHLIVLTSEALYVAPGLAAEFLAGGPVRGLAKARQHRLRAVDCYLIDGRWLWVEMPDHVVRLSVDDLASGGPSQGIAVEASPDPSSDWEPMSPTSWTSYPSVVAS